MITTRILLASVLKPINDTRMFHKLGLSLGKIPGTEVHIAGFAAPSPPAPPNLFFYPLFHFSRLSPGRLLASWRFLVLLFKLKPRLVVAGTFELLLPALVYKLLRPCHLVYDVRENYALNLRTQQVFPPLLRQVLAALVRALENFAAPYVHTFFLAEESYLRELPFAAGRPLVLENKFKPYGPESGDAAARPERLSSRQLSHRPIRLLYSGTISRLYGVFEAIALCERLNQVAPGFTLTIIGYCPQPSVLLQVKAAIRDNPAIQLLGGGRLVPHPRIVEAIRESDLGLLPYHPHPSLFRCRPTKLFEYLAASLPVLVQHNPYWENMLKENEAGLMVDFGNYQPEDLYQALISTTFYSSSRPETVFWDSEETKLLSWANKTILPR